MVPEPEYHLLEPSVSRTNGGHEEGRSSGGGERPGTSDKDKEPFYLFQFAGVGVLVMGMQSQLSLCAVSEHLKHFHNPFLSLNLSAMHKQSSGKHMAPQSEVKGVARLGSKQGGAFQSNGNYSYRTDPREVVDLRPAAWRRFSS